jgi:transmembrane sensor
MVMLSLRRRDVEAEAAAWVARLQSTSRDTATEAALKSWLGADPRHREAFERATEVWTIIPGAATFEESAQPRLGLIGHWPRARGRQLARALAVALSLLLVIGGPAVLMRHDRPASYVTGVGEQEVAALSDGSRVALNTDTALVVDYKPDIRQITLEHGEAMFDVAHNSARPFIVAAGDMRIRAVGTSFIVRRIDGDVQVTLLKGKVAVRMVAGAGSGGPKPTMLVPGERMTAAANAVAAIDRPSIETVTAWRRGQIVFDETPLASAAAQLASYGGPRVIVTDPRIAATPVSGVFATDDAAEFAEAVAKLHGWRIEKVGSEYRIGR